MSDANDQAVEFFIKRADYNLNLAAQHCRGKEFEKGMNLYKEAYSFMMKALKSRPDDAVIKKKVEDTKFLYQEAKKNCTEHGGSPVPK
jgi:hypothetical protein